MTTHDDLAAQAAYYASLGLASFPLHGIEPGPSGLCTCYLHEDCQRPGKHPATPHGHKDATLDASTFRSLLSTADDNEPRNLGVATGCEADTGSLRCLVVVDIDPRHDGTESFNAFAETLLDVADLSTYTVTTGSGGKHLYYLSSSPVRTAVGLLPGVDIKAEGGYVVAPPSLHSSGQRYSTAANLPIRALPTPLLQLLDRSATLLELAPTLAEHPAYKNSPTLTGHATQGISPERQAEILSDPASLLPGERDTFFTFTARDLCRNGNSEQQVLDVLAEVHSNMPDSSDFPIHVVVNKIERAFRDIPPAERLSQLTVQAVRNATTTGASPVNDTTSTEVVTFPIVPVPIPTTFIVTSPPPFRNQSGLIDRRCLRTWNPNSFPSRWHPSHDALARIAFQQYGDLIRYIEDADDWMVWHTHDSNGNLLLTPVWKRGRQGEVIDLIVSTLHVIAELCVPLLTDPKEGAKLENWALTVAKQEPYLVNTLKALGRRVPVLTEDLNAHPKVLPIINGVIDFDTYEPEPDHEFLDMTDIYDAIRLHPHTPERLFTKVANLRHGGIGVDDLIAAHPIWNTAIQRWFPDPEVRHFAQRLLGYALFGNGQEKVFVIAHGKTNSGKSAFFNNLSALLDGFAQEISPDDILLQRFNDKEKFGLSHLPGARLIVTSETPPTAKLNAALLKQLTGGDTIRIRAGMRKDFIDFKNRGLLVILTNHLPTDDQLDEALFKRMVVLPFEAEFAPGDPGTIPPAVLTDILRQESNAILHWLLMGYTAYLAIGLEAPQAILDAHAAAVDDQDWLSPVLERFTIKAAEPPLLRDCLSCKELLDAYHVWCAENGEDPLTSKAFYSAVNERIGPSRNCGPPKQRKVYPGYLFRTQATSPADVINSL